MDLLLECLWCDASLNYVNKRYLIYSNLYIRKRHWNNESCLKLSLTQWFPNFFLMDHFDDFCWFLSISLTTPPPSSNPSHKKISYNNKSKNNIICAYSTLVCLISFPVCLFILCKIAGWYYYYFENILTWHFFQLLEGVPLIGNFEGWYCY